MSPGDPYFDFFSSQAHGPVPLFEVSDLNEAYEELVAAGVEVVGPRSRDSVWEWIHFRAPDGNLSTNSRRVGTAIDRRRGGAYAVWRRELPDGKRPQSEVRCLGCPTS
jgi:hypothetical protein